MRFSLLNGAKDMGSEFERCCKEYTHLDFSVAWCGDPDYVLPYEHLKNITGRLRATVGISFNHTHPDAMIFLKDIGADLRVVAADAELFHPKVYVFSKGSRVAVILGSSNLTHGGFYENTEVNCIYEGVPARREQSQIDGLLENMKVWRAKARAFVPTAKWLAAYRKAYEECRKRERKSKILSPVQAEQQIAKASWLKDGDWKTYYGRVQGCLQTRYDEGGRQRLFNTLRAAKEELPCPWNTTYFADLQKRRVMGGYGSYGPLGRVGASGKFRHFLARGTSRQRRVVVSAINAMAQMNHPLPFAAVERRLNELVALGFTMKVWGRFLCLVRPDLYCTVASVGVRTNMSELTGESQSSFARPAGYVNLLRVIHSSPWFNAPRPSSKEERHVWSKRVALLDAVL